MTRTSFVLVSIVALVSCGGRCGKKDVVPDTTTPPVAPKGATAHDPPAFAPLPSDLPAGHWESGSAYAADHLCLTIYPYGGVRIVAPAPGFRNPARITGMVVGARPSEDKRTWELTIDVDKIVAKEIGPCRKAWVDYPLAEAHVLGLRVTPPAERIALARSHDPDAGGPPKTRASFTLSLDADGKEVELCAVGELADASAPRCRKLVKQASTHTTVAAPPEYGCKTDVDCTQMRLGEACDPCGCGWKPVLVSKREEVLKTYSAAAAECPPLPDPRTRACPPCIETRARCRHDRCVLDAPDAGP